MKKSGAKNFQQEDFWRTFSLDDCEHNVRTVLWSRFEKSSAKTFIRESFTEFSKRAQRLSVLCLHYTQVANFGQAFLKACAGQGREALGAIRRWPNPLSFEKRRRG